MSSVRGHSRTRTRTIIQPVSPISSTSVSSVSPANVRMVVTSVPVFRARCVDDARIDYTSLLDSEQRRARFSEELLDTELRESVRLQKMYRELQRQVNCWDKHKVSHYDHPSRKELVHTHTDSDRRLQAWLERKRMRDVKLKASTMSALAKEAQLEKNLADIESLRTKIFVNPCDNEELYLNQIKEIPDIATVKVCDKNKNSKPERQSLVTFKIPPSEKHRCDEKTERANVMVTSGALLFILIAATLVTATFLMSPVIEDAFATKNSTMSVSVMKNLTETTVTEGY